MRLRRVEECGTVEPTAKAPRLAVCPNCRKAQKSPPDKMAHCPHCGNIWPWQELHLVRGRAA